MQPSDVMQARHSPRRSKSWDVGSENYDLNLYLQSLKEDCEAAVKALNPQDPFISQKAGQPGQQAAEQQSLAVVVIPSEQSALIPKTSFTQKVREELSAITGAIQSIGTNLVNGHMDALKQNSWKILSSFSSIVTTLVSSKRDSEKDKTLERVVAAINPVMLSLSKKIADLHKTLKTAIEKDNKDNSEAYRLHMQVIDAFIKTYEDQRKTQLVLQTSLQTVSTTVTSEHRRTRSDMNRSFAETHRRLLAVEEQLRLYNESDTSILYEVRETLEYASFPSDQFNKFLMRLKTAATVSSKKPSFVELGTNIQDFDILSHLRAGLSFSRETFYHHPAFSKVNLLRRYGIQKKWIQIRTGSSESHQSLVSRKKITEVESHSDLVNPRMWVEHVECIIQLVQKKLTAKRASQKEEDENTNLKKLRQIMQEGQTYLDFILQNAKPYVIGSGQDYLEALQVVLKQIQSLLKLSKKNQRKDKNKAIAKELEEEAVVFDRVPIVSFDDARYKELEIRLRESPKKLKPDMHAEYERYMVRLGGKETNTEVLSRQFQQEFNERFEFNYHEFLIEMRTHAQMVFENSARTIRDRSQNIRLGLTRSQIIYPELSATAAGFSVPLLLPEKGFAIPSVLLERDFNLTGKVEYSYSIVDKNILQIHVYFRGLRKDNERTLLYILQRRFEDITELNNATLFIVWYSGRLATMTDTIELFYKVVKGKTLLRAENLFRALIDTGSLKLTNNRARALFDDGVLVDSEGADISDSKINTEKRLTALSRSMVNEDDIESAFSVNGMTVTYKGVYPPKKPYPAAREKFRENAYVLANHRTLKRIIEVATLLNLNKEAVLEQKRRYQWICQYIRLNPNSLLLNSFQRLEATYTVFENACLLFYEEACLVPPLKQFIKNVNLLKTQEQFLQLLEEFDGKKSLHATLEQSLTNFSVQLKSLSEDEMLEPNSSLVFECLAKLRTCVATYEIYVARHFDVKLRREAEDNHSAVAGGQNANASKGSSP